MSLINLGIVVWVLRYFYYNTTVYLQAAITCTALLNPRNKLKRSAQYFRKCLSLSALFPCFLGLNAERATKACDDPFSWPGVDCLVKFTKRKQSTALKLKEHNQ